MLDANGTLIRLGHRVAIGGGIEGKVVFSIDTDEYSPEFLKQHWNYLGRGIMVETDAAGLIHLECHDGDVTIIPEA
jgi:hypothetical protein